MLERLNVGPIRSCSATLAGGAVVVGDLLSDVTVFGSGCSGEDAKAIEMLQDAIIKDDDGTVRQKTCNNSQQPYDGQPRQPDSRSP